MCLSTKSNIDTAVMHIVEKLGEDEKHLLLVTKIRVIQDTFENNGRHLFDLRTNMDDTPAPLIAPRESVSQVGNQRRQRKTGWTKSRWSEAGSSVGDSTSVESVSSIVKLKLLAACAETTRQVAELKQQALASKQASYNGQIEREKRENNEKIEREKHESDERFQRARRDLEERHVKKLAQKKLAQAILLAELV